MFTQTPSMTDINPRFEQHEEYRVGVREVCARFDSAYWQGVDKIAAYPEEFVKALTEAGWLAALIPTEYGGSGLSLSEASVILEEINRSGANSGACHAQMYIMGTLLRHGSAEQKQRYLPKIASRRAAPPVVRRHRADDGNRHDEAQDLRRATRRSLRRERAEGLDLARSAFRPDAAAGAHDSALGGRRRSPTACRSFSSIWRTPSSAACACGRSATW